MRITGRQLRQIIKEEVENMMSEVDATNADMVKKFTDTLQAGIAPGSVTRGNIIGTSQEADTRGLPVYKGTIFRKLAGAPGTSDVIRNAVFSAPLKPGAGPGTPLKPVNINLVVDVGVSGRIISVTAMAVDGVKVETGLPVLMTTSAGEKAVTADIMTTVRWGSSPLIDPENVKLNSIKFRA